MSDRAARARVSPAAPLTLAPVAVAGISRLRLSAEVQDLTGVAKAPRFATRPRAERAARWLVDLARWRRVRAQARGRQAGALDRAVLRLLRVVSLGKRGWAAPADVRPAPADGQVAGYVTSSVGEELVVRLSLLLRLMRRHRDAVDLLTRRVTSAMPSEQSRFWLSFLLTHVKEKKAAAAVAVSGAVAPAGGAAGTPAAARPQERSRLRYGIIVLTMFDSDVFRSSLRSLVESDFDGRVVVVEDGYSETDTCRAFCEALGVTYLKRTEWKGSAAAMNDGIGLIADETDVVMFAHNDVLWPPSWFAWVDRVWGQTFDAGHVGLLNLGYQQFKRNVDNALSELFVRGEYRHLHWILNAMRDMPALRSGRVQDSQVHSGEHLFGLARDPWNDWTPDVRFMTGRFSIGASFPVATWRAIGGFEPTMPYGFDLELQHYCLTHRQWMLFANNPPLIHLASSDTRAVDHARRMETPGLHDTYGVFEAKYGWQLEHFINIYFSESAFIHHDAIVRAANALRFEDIDFVFDDFQQRLRERRLSNCELTWCRSRSACQYVDAPTAPVLQVTRA